MMATCGKFSARVAPNNLLKVKFFDFPPKKCFLRTDGISSIYNSMEAYVDSYLTSGIKVPFTITYGTRNQYDFCGPYSGSQCTSMSLAAIGWWSLIGDFGNFRRTDVERVMETGHALHKVLRNDYKLSSNSDKRIAIDDLPRRLEVGIFDGWSRFLSPEDADSMVLTSPLEDIDGLPLLKDYLKGRLDANKGAPEAYLLTIGSSSNAIMRTKSGKWLWFDSHGSQQVSATPLKRPGSVTKLASLHDLEKFVIALRGPKEYCQIRSLTCERVKEESDDIIQPAPVDTGLDNKKAAVEKPTRPPTPLNPEPVASQTARPAKPLTQEPDASQIARPPTPLTPESVVSQGVISTPSLISSSYSYSEEDVDDSCFVTFMGGFGSD